jgi:hypothetical protein
MGFERQIGRPVKLECINLDGEKDVFYIKPLPFKHMPDYFKLVKEVMKLQELFPKDSVTQTPEQQEDTSKKLLEKLDENTLKLMSSLIMETLKYSYPQEKEATLSEFATVHMFELLNCMLEANTSGKSPAKN